MSYIDLMQQKAIDQYDKLYEGITQLKFFDFPDYPNVGDSAIALGQLEYFRGRNIEVVNAYCIGTLNRNALKTATPAVINGGGNIAGFFQGIDDHRNRISQELDDRAILIQAPQSVHFNTSAAREHFIERFAARKNLRMSVRDQDALQEVSPFLPNTVLAPDAVHHLGKIDSNQPTQKTLILARRDQESSQAGILRDSVDWNKDPRMTRQRTSLRWKAKYLGPLGTALNLSVGAWAEVAQSRLTRGVSTLSPGETVVTDRLHAMLIALQMGREVFAVDNNNLKLSKYANTWFSNAEPRLRFFKTFEDAIAASRR